MVAQSGGCAMTHRANVRLSASSCTRQYAMLGNLSYRLHCKAARCVLVQEKVKNLCAKKFPAKNRSVTAIDESRKCSENRSTRRYIKLKFRVRLAAITA